MRSAMAAGERAVDRIIGKIGQSAVTASSVNSPARSPSATASASAVAAAAQFARNVCPRPASSAAATAASAPVVEKLRRFRDGAKRIAQERRYAPARRSIASRRDAARLLPSCHIPCTNSSLWGNRRAPDTLDRHDEFDDTCQDEKRTRLVDREIIRVELPSSDCRNCRRASPRVFRSRSRADDA